MSPEEPVPPPGWYPDDKRRSLERFSDGNTWTGESRKRPWWRLLTPPGLQTRRGRVLVVVAAVLLLAATVGAVLTDPSQEEMPASELAAGDGPRLPAAERGFLAIVADGQEASEDASDVKVVNERRLRGEALCAFLPRSLRIRDWRGVVTSLDTAGLGDDAELRVSVADGVELVGVDEAIEPESALYDALADLRQGDAVTFAGRFVSGDHCLRENSTFDSSQMLTPDFSFRFTAVGLAEDDS